MVDDRVDDQWDGGGVPPGWGSPPPGPGWATPGGAPPPPPAPPGAGPGWGTPSWWAPKPGVVPLRPLGVGELLDGAFATIRRYPKVTLGLSAAVVVVQELLGLALRLSLGGVASAATSTAGALAQLTTASGLVVLAVSQTLSMVLVGLLSVVVGEAVLGRPVTARDVWARVRPRSGRLLGAAFLAGLLPFVGLVALVVGGIFLWGALALTMPALVLERTTVRGALRRSWRLALPDWWRVFGVRALAWLIAAVVSAVIAVPAIVVAVVSAAGTGFATGATLGAGVLALATGLGVVAGTLTQPFVAGVLALLYVDRRMRAEALDLTLAREAAGAGPERR